MIALRRSVVGVAAAIALVVAVPALVTLVVLPDVVLTLKPSTTTPLDDALRYFRTNATTALVLAGAAALLGLPHARTKVARLATGLLDGLLGLGLAYHFAQVGLALGATGVDGARFLVHLPLEAIAIALAGGAYVHARSGGRPAARVLVTVAAAVVALLVVAALVEAFATPRAGTLT